MAAQSKNLLIARSVSLVLLVAAGAVAHAEEGSAKTPDQVDLGTVAGSSGVAAGMTVDVYVSRGSAAAVAPSQANLAATEPQSVISRAFIEDAVAPTGNFNSIVAIAPSVTTQPSPNGPGLMDTKSSMRGFQDGEYTVTFDGIPFGDSNDPTHHSTAYFPAQIIGGVVVERGPGNASDLGQSNYGGSINLLSKTPSEASETTAYGSIGSWSTELLGAQIESGRLENSGDATVSVTAQHLQGAGYLSYESLRSDTAQVKVQRKLGASSLLTVFSTFTLVKTPLPDSTTGATLAQVALYGRTYGLSSDPTSQGYYGYNQVDKRTDFSYVRLQSGIGSRVELDNRLYTYGYNNSTIAGADATGGLANTAKFMGKVVPAGGVPGYDKLNHYRVIGDIYKMTVDTGVGLLRLGTWLETSNTSRHNMGMDMTTGVLTGGLKSIQDSSWKQYQFFAEYEWKPLESTTVTPGVKYMHFDRKVDAVFNQGSKVAAKFDELYTSTLPFLTINQRLGNEYSVYAQYAKGLQVPSLSFLQVATPVNAPEAQQTTNYQVGLVHKSARFTWDIDAYTIDFNNMIGSTIVAGQTDFYNAGGARYKGFEGEATFVLGGGFSVYLAGSSNDANYKAGNAAGNVGAVPLAPKSTLALGALYNQGPWNASLMFKQTGTQWAVANEAAGYQLPSYSNADLNVAYTFDEFSGFKKLKLQASIYNLLDGDKVTSIVQGGSAVYDQYLWQAPRSYMLSFRASF